MSVENFYLSLPFCISNSLKKKKNSLIPDFPQITYILLHVTEKKEMDILY